MIGRRAVVAALLAAPLGPLRAAAPAADPRPVFAAATPRPLVFPRDHGAHPEYRTEWWYLTGVLDDGAAPVGVQLTFFRSRTGITSANPSAFAAQQLIVGHVAIAEAAQGALLHDERIARTGFGAAAASTLDTDVTLGRWRLARAADGRYRATLPARGFALELEATPTQPLLLQGVQGFSQKGPEPAHASHYYTQPQLALAVTLTRNGTTRTLRGVGWLDHEWSSTVLAADAAGWDWIGMNLDDGSALTAFRIRPRAPAAADVHAYAALRPPGGAVRVFERGEVRFTPLQHWTSARTRATWPVAQQVQVGERVFRTAPLMADQELDARVTTGAVYWEGASRLLEGERAVGRGYLEMTGYLQPMQL